MKVWRVLDVELQGACDGGRLLIPLLSYTTFLRFQRNRYIETLVDMGFTQEQIGKRLEQQLGERLSRRHIYRLSKT